MVTVLPDWWNIGDLGRLVEPETASVVLREAGLDVASVAPDYLKVKGDEAALVGFSMQTESSHGDAVTIPGYARTFASRERAGEVFAKALRKKVVVTAGGPGVSMTADGRTVIFLFPNDGELDGLRRIAEWSSCRRALTELPAFAGYRIRKSAGTLTPVRYKPERRLVARLGLVLEDSRSGDLASIDAYLRWFRDGRGVALAAIAADLAAAGVPVPAPIGVGVGGRLVVEHAAIGSSATTAIRRGELDVGAVVDAVVRMKGVPVTPDAVGDRRTAARTVAGAIASLDTLAAFDGGLAGSACQIAVALRSTRLDEEPVGVVHGDLHLDQIVVDGNAIALVDLERFGVGSPSLDAAMLSAHIIELAVRDRSASGHLAVTAEDVRREWSRRTATSDRQFSVYVACALVERALLAFRRLEAGRVATALGLLEAAQATLPGPTLEVVYPRPAGSWGGRGVDDNGTTVFAVLGGDIEWREPGTDPDLPGLAPLLDRGELLSYRPGRRAVVAVDEGAVFAKVLRPRRAEACAERFRVARQLSEATVGAPRVPAVLPPLVEGPGVVFLQGLPGRPLHTWLTDTVEEAGRRRAIARAAGILGQFQALPVDAVDLPGAAEGGDPSDWVEVVAAAQPGWRAPYADVAARFADAPASMRVALVHGDLHDRNLLLDGGVGGILDLDALGVGDPAIDTGNLVAHLYLRALQRGDGPAVGTEDVATLLGAHRGESEAVGYWSARSLFRLACIYRFRRRWAHLAPQLLRDSAAWMTTGPGPDPAARSASGP